MRTLLLFTLFIIVLTSCDKSNKLTYAEKKLIGSWFYSDVDYNPDFGFKKDITKQHVGEILTFKTDFTFTLENTVDNTISEGVWEINQINSNGQNNNSAIYDQVVIAYNDNSSGELKQIIWDNFSPQNRKIRADNYTKDGYYTYELKRY